MLCVSVSIDVDLTSTFRSVEVLENVNLTHGIDYLSHTFLVAMNHKWLDKVVYDAN